MDERKLMYLKGRPQETNTRLYSRNLLLVSLVTALTACGGGGGGDSTPGSSTNQAPRAENQSYSVNRADTLRVNAPGVLANSSDPENDELSAQVVNAPNHGTLTLKADGSFNYVHNGGGAEEDSFTYLASDGANSSAPATVTINVNGVPVTNNVCLPEETLPGDLNNFVSDDNTLLNYSVQTDPTQGTLTLSPDGAVSYTLNAGNENFRGVDSFTYLVDDSNGGTATGSVNIIVGKTRIMPLGDSITVGVTPASCPNNPIPPSEQIGYRAKLLQNLADAGYIVDFVGNQSNGEDVTPPIIDPDHQGKGGYRATDVESEILNVLRDQVNGAPADIILLHIGTNNINADNPNATINDIQQILNDIDIWEGETNNPVTVMLSTVVERSTEPLCETPNFPNPNVEALNDLIINTVTNRKGTDNIALVDQHSIIGGDVQAGSTPPTGLSIDGVHPSAEGYERMADEWFNQLTDPANSEELVSLFEELKCPVN